MEGAMSTMSHPLRVSASSGSLGQVQPRDWLEELDSLDSPTLR